MSDLSTLNAALFKQLEALGGDDLSGDKLTDKINQTRSMEGIAKVIISNAQLQLDAIKLQTEYPAIAKNNSLSGLIEGPKK